MFIKKIPMILGLIVWIYNYLCNLCLSPLRLWIWIPLRRGVLNTTLCAKVCQWIAVGQRFSLGTPVSSSNKTDCHGITEILLKVVLNTITLLYDLTLLFDIETEQDKLNMGFDWVIKDTFFIVASLISMMFH